MGFRPLVYRIAKRAGVAGYVRNMGGAEVEIYLEGTRESIERFFKLFWREKPAAVLIERILVEKACPRGVRDFAILPSSSSSLVRSVIPPDFAICDECLREVLDSTNKRRYRYPFNSCVFCGPRFSMMYDSPWDRDRTAMRNFPLCSECLKEYMDPSNVRRFHAQGISCAMCGPRVMLLTRDGEPVNCKDPLREAARLIDEGHIVAIKGVGGFHIACLASNDDVVLKLRKRKRRPEKPFAVMALDVDTASKLVELDEKALEILRSPQRPILLLPLREDAPVSRYVAPGLAHLGVFLPYTALHYLLLSETKDRFAIMTSGNVHGKPMCIKNDQALRELRDIVDFFLVHNREIVNRVDDSVIRFTAGEPVLLRRGRGYAPYWIKVPLRTEGTIVCLGALLQNAGAIMFEDKVVLTQYIGDCDDFDTLLDLEHYLNVIARMYRANLTNAVFVCDLHPRYTTTNLAEILAEKHHGKLLRVQHHWAHIASAMADRGIQPGEEVIGVAIDGAGYGEDGQIWGGEIMTCTYLDYRRVAHLEYVPMPGGDLAVEYPLRMAIAHLYKIYDEEEIRRILSSLGLLKRGLKQGEDELRVTLNLCRKPTILTSSMGRLLDAVSALLGICLRRTYEGEPAIKLEETAHKCRRDPVVLDLRVESEGDKYIIRTTEIFEYIVNNIDRLDKALLARSILYSIGLAIGKCIKIVRSRAHDKVVLSGGASVNEFIVQGIIEVLKDTSIKVLLPKKVPPNDGGIALGQAVIAAMISERQAPGDL